MTKKFSAGWAGSWWSKCWVPDDLVESQKEKNYLPPKIYFLKINSCDKNENQIDYFNVNQLLLKRWQMWTSKTFWAKQ